MVNKLATIVVAVVVRINAVLRIFPVCRLGYITQRDNGTRPSYSTTSLQRKYQVLPFMTCPS